MAATATSDATSTDLTVPSLEAPVTTVVRSGKRRWLTIDETRFTDPQELKRCHGVAVAAGLLTAAEMDRLAFCAAWCSAARKHREGRVRHPAAVMQFLLRNPKALRAYAAEGDEAKAREAIRRLWPAKAYCPHG
jgi:hypothetical protein